jgi:hypothetical protein
MAHLAWFSFFRNFMAKNPATRRIRSMELAREILLPVL